MKKKENLWQLLKGLDEEASAYNSYLTEANRYFDTTSKTARKILKQHEEDLHKIIREVKKTIKPLLKNNKPKKNT
jgi:hypothetical protein